MIVAPYNFEEESGIKGFIFDFKNEFPDNDHRNTILDELETFILEIINENAGLKETVDTQQGKITQKLNSDLEEVQSLARKINVKVQHIREGK